MMIDLNLLKDLRSMNLGLHWDQLRRIKRATKMSLSMPMKLVKVNRREYCQEI